MARLKDHEEIIGKAQAWLVERQEADGFAQIDAKPNRDDDFLPQGDTLPAD